MGKHIDRAALLLLSIAGFYFFFLNAWHSIPLACMAAFVCCALLRVVIVRRPRKQRCTAQQAEAELLRIAALPDAEAEQALEKLVRGKFPREDFLLVSTVKHPDASLSCSDILNLWKANRQANRIVIAATCGCDARAAAYARELSAPAAAVVDRRMLARIIRESGQYEPPRPAASRPGLKRRLHRLMECVAAQRMTPKDALIAATLLAMYLVIGNALYLILSLCMLLRFGVSLAQRREPRRLFE